MGHTHPNHHAGTSAVDVSGAGRRRAARRSRRSAALVALAAVVVAGMVVVAVVGPGASGSASRSAATRARSVDAASVPALPAAPGDAATSVQPDPDSPPPDPDPAAPGQVVQTGEDQSDPFLFLDGNRYYLYTSGIPGPPVVNVPVSSSPDFATWTGVTDALPDLPAWVAPGFTWAPDIHRFGSRYVLYFTALVRGSDPAMECIGDAVGSSPIGPFAAFPAPFICQPTLGGDIDPRVFEAPDGSLFMLWKSDQNIGGGSTPTQMWSQPLSADGLTLTGQPALLLHPDELWEGTIVEAPDMVEVGGVYWMIFSGNWFNQPDYAIGAASCAGPQGPCTDLPGNPLLASNAQGEGPGEASLFADRAGVWLLYSPWRSMSPHPDIPPRPVEITRLGFTPTGPYLAAGGTPPPLDPLGLYLWRPPAGG